jgi:hypothetical protein
MGGLVGLSADDRRHYLLPYNPIPLTARRIVTCCLPGGHDPFGKDLHISEQDILDKSKADWLVKTLAAFQILWLLASVIIRIVRDLPVSQLEVYTSAFVTLAIFTSAAQKAKPKNINVSILGEKLTC